VNHKVTRVLDEKVDDMADMADMELAVAMVAMGSTDDVGKACEAYDIEVDISLF
jgi:hypothetical protein